MRLSDQSQHHLPKAWPDAARAVSAVAATNWEEDLDANFTANNLGGVDGASADACSCMES